MPSMQINNAKRRERMNLFGLMETSGSAMQAERMRAEVVAANMANAETTRTASGGPYHRQHIVFAANPGPVGGNDSGAAGVAFRDSFANVAGSDGLTTGMPLVPLPAIAGRNEPARGGHVGQA